MNEEADMGKKQVPSDRRLVSKAGGVMPERQQRIAQRAYELYATRGYRQGHDLEDWLEAEQELAERGLDRAA